MKLLLIILGLSFSTLSFSEIKKNALAKSCDSYDKVTSIMAPYLNQAWPGMVATPTGPVPVLTNFVMAGRQPISDFCRYMKSLESLDTLGGIHATANYVNTVTDNQYREHIDFVMDTMDTGVAVHKYTNGQNGRSSESVGLHRKINRYLRTSDKYFAKRKGKEATTFISKHERQAQAKKMIASSNRLALLKESGSCINNNPGMSDEDYSYYQNNIKPYYNLEDEYSDETEYHLSKLQELGIKMVTKGPELREYQRELLNLQSTYAIVKRKGPLYSKKKITTNGESKFTQKPYYKYSATVNSKKGAIFVKKYEKKWRSYVLYQLTQRPKLLTDRRSIMNQEYRSLAYECRRSKISWDTQKNNSSLMGKTHDDPEFSNAFDLNMDNCKKGIKLKKSYLNNLFVFYVNGLFKYSVSKKRSMAIIWSYESEFMKIHRNLTLSKQKTPAGEISKTEIECSDSINFAGSEYLKLKVQNESLEARAMMAEQITLDSLEYEKQFNKRARARRESQNTRTINKTIRERRTGPTYMEIPPTPNF